MDTRPSSPELQRPPRIAVAPLATPSLRELTAIATALWRAESFEAGAIQLQRDLRRLFGIADALCIWIDWPQRTAHSVCGKLGPQLEDLVFDVAGTGRREIIANTLIEPIGRSPARAVFALRRKTCSGFTPTEVAMISGLAQGIAPALDRLQPGGQPLARGSNR